MPINLQALGIEPEQDDLAKRLAKQLTAGKSREDLIRLAGLIMRNQAEHEQADESAEQPQGMPQTPDELWNYIVWRYGVRIARVSVCPDHDTPFDYVCAGFFEWYPNVFGIGPRGGGKCLSEGTLIYDPATGLDRPIEQVAEHALVGSLDADGGVVSSEVSRAFFSGEKECFEVVTASGRRVTGSADHLLLTADGWTRIEDLEVGGAVAIPARLPSHGLKRVSKQDTEMLAVLLAEGNYTQPGIVSFTSYDGEIVAIAERSAEWFGGSLHPRGNGAYGLVGRGRGYSNPFRELLDEYGCGCLKAPEKRIPDAIMAAPQQRVTRFLSIFWMCDGWIGHRAPEISLASEQMVRQIQRLLLRLGIQSRVSKGSGGYGTDDVFDRWRLTVYAKFVEDFSRQIKLWGEKKVKLDAIVAKTRNSNVGRPVIPDWLPGLLSAPLASMTRAERGDRSRAIASDLGWATNKHTKGLQALTAGGVKTVQARRLRSMCERTPGVDKRRLAHLLSEDLWWDAIVSIEPVGVKRTYDLTVPSTGCFVAGDMLVHNSYDQALLHDLNSHWKNGCESATFGAVEEQAKRVYAAFKTFVDRSEIIGEPRISETNYKPVGDMNYGSKVEVLGGTVAAVNGPHPQKAHSDEVEIMRADTWKESRNLASAKTTPDGRHIKAQNYGTSTMKWKGGRVWQILESFKRAKQRAIERYGAGEENRELVDDLISKTTTFYVLVWCIFEVAEQVPNCRAAPENADLPEWEPGLDRSECKCDCHEIVNGSLEAQDDEGEPLPRTLESECDGRFYLSRGHRTRAEVIQLFLQNDPRTWRAQQLCRDTETEGLYIPSFSRNRHGLARFPFDLANGPIYTGTDWGFVDEAAVLWTQYLERAVEAIRYDGKTIILPRGARVAISELTISQKTATELGQMAILREVKLASVLSINRVAVRKRWADLQGAGDRRDWAKMGLKTVRYSTRNFDEHVKEWRGLVDANRFYVVVDEDRFTGMGCPVLCEQLEGWREEDGKESRELPQHVVSAGRYVIYGMHDVYMDSGAQSPEQTEAVRMAAGQGSAPAAKRYHDSDDTKTELAQAGWRSQF